MSGIEASMLAARAGIGAAALALVALTALHILKPDIHPSRTMISQYALGPYGWMMALCFGAFAVGGTCLFAALVLNPPSLAGWIGLAFMLVASAGLGMAACFPMDPTSTPAARMTFSGRMHGVAFQIGVPSQLIAVSLLSFSLRSEASHSPVPLLMLAAAIWLSILFMVAIMMFPNKAKSSNPDESERFPGWPNRLFMVAYGVWLMVAAWPMAR